MVTEQLAIRIFSKTILDNEEAGDELKIPLSVLS